MAHEIPAHLGDKASYNFWRENKTRFAAYLERDASLGSVGVGGFVPFPSLDLGFEAAAGLTNASDRATGSVFLRYHFGR